MRLLTQSDLDVDCQSSIKKYLNVQNWIEKTSQLSFK